MLLKVPVFQLIDNLKVNIFYLKITFWNKMMWKFSIDLSARSHHFFRTLSHQLYFNCARELERRARAQSALFVKYGLW
jgi:hypothetical protein